jgi:hypothetical protein
MDTQTAEELILTAILKGNGIRTSELASSLIGEDDGSNTKMNRIMFYRALKNLNKHEKIESEKKVGKKEVKYYVTGQRYVLPIGRKPNEFDLFVIEQCKQKLEEILDSGLLDVDYFARPVNRHDAEAMIVTLSKTKILVRSWESMRGVQVKRYQYKPPESFGDTSGSLTLKNMASRIDLYFILVPWYHFLIAAIDTISSNYQDIEPKKTTTKGPRKNTGVRKSSSKSSS